MPWMLDRVISVILPERDTRRVTCKVLSIQPPERGNLEPVNRRVEKYYIINVRTNRHFGVSLEEQEIYSSFSSSIRASYTDFLSGHATPAAPEKSSLSHIDAMLKGFTIRAPHFTTHSGL